MLGLTVATAIFLLILWFLHFLLLPTSPFFWLFLAMYFLWLESSLEFSILICYLAYLIVIPAFHPKDFTCKETTCDLAQAGLPFIQPWIDGQSEFSREFLEQPINTPKSMNDPY